MTIRMKTKKSNGNREVHKPFLTGSPYDEKTVGNGLKFFGTFFLTFVISLIVLSLNLFGDGLRDAFDPKLNA